MQLDTCLTQAVRNERLTEDLLEYKHDLIERVQEQLDKQVRRGVRTAGSQSSSDSIQCLLKLQSSCLVTMTAGRGLSCLYRLQIKVLLHTQLRTVTACTFVFSQAAQGGN